MIAGGKMKLLSRNICVQKTYDDAYQVITSCNYRLSKGHFERNSFAIDCPKRFNGGIISLIPVKGTISQHDHFLEVVLSIHANWSFYLGCILCVLGAIGALFSILSDFSRWIPAVGSMMIGMLICGQVLWEGKNTLDMIERKLLAECKK